MLKTLPKYSQAAVREFQRRFQALQDWRRTHPGIRFQPPYGSPEASAYREKVREYQLRWRQRHPLRELTKRYAS